MNRRSFLQSILSASVATGCATEAAAQTTVHPAVERYRRLQAALLKSRRLDFTERDVHIASLGLRAHVVEVGRGEPLLLLHGGGGVGAHWVPLMTRLSGRHLIVPDRPGCGLSDGFVYDGVDPRTHAVDFVAGILDALKVQRASIVGNSMGGYYALCFALAHPDRVHKLVVAGGPAGSAGLRTSGEAGKEAIEARMKTSWRPAEPGGIPDDLRELFDARLAIPGSEESWRSVIRSARQNRTTFALHSELKALRTPTLFIWGEQDRIDPPLPEATAIAQQMPNGRLVLLPDGSHTPWMEKPAECAARIAEVLAEAGA
jgi:pimeloyl-ACP methyl ester carboxylesterase